MERKMFIVLDDKEKQTLHQAAEIMQSVCNLTDSGNSCFECPFENLCNNKLKHDTILTDFAKDLLNI